ncbi:UDP-3-O-acyl-N-acetylglucosamine deacetylase [Paracoccaceae bacterium GXU_MW_L88]
MQTTLKKSVTLIGTGLHSGRPVRMTIAPQPADFGIWFRRTDAQGNDTLIPALYDSVENTTLCTRIAGENGVTLSTIEHIMAALAGCGVHNALVSVDGPEVPIMDGSSQRFVRAIREAGLRRLDAPLYAIEILKPVRYEDGAASAELHPHDGFAIDFTIDFDDAAIGHQEIKLDMSNGQFMRELSDCRTFCRRGDVDMMQQNGLALGGGLENAVVVEGDKVLNPEGFRRSNECVRHKALDAVGDLGLAGHPILGHYIGNRAGHGITNRLLHTLFAQPDAWRLVEVSPETARKLPGGVAALTELREAV